MDFSIGFLIQKGLTLLLMPMSLGVILSMIILWCLHRKNYKKAKVFLYINIVWMSMISYAPVANFLLLPLENTYPKLEKIPKGIEYILLLGGDRDKRAWEALRLYQNTSGVKIITSGYSFYDKVSDAQKTAELLLNSGVEDKDIVMQHTVKKTTDEAKAMKKRLEDTPFVLVTSAYHMPRAMKIFEHQGLHPIAAPTDFSNPNETGITSIWKAKYLKQVEHAWHEYLGLFWFYIKGE